MSRKLFLKGSPGTRPDTAALVMGIIALALISTAVSAVGIEINTLDELYAAAMEEGGNLVLRAGGDKPDQSDYILDMFKARFPNIKVTHTVDLSKFHAPRFDNALETGGHENVPDVIQLQTLHDFDYYAQQGLLMAYKPKDWDKVYPDYKDPHGRWTGLFGVSFSNMVNIDVIDEDKAPRDAMDYLMRNSLPSTTWMMWLCPERGNTNENHNCRGERKDRARG